MMETIVNGLVSLCAAFLGAWFAYKFNLRQQKKWDKERQKEEKEAQRIKQISALNYLQTYLYFYIDELHNIYEKLDYKQRLYDKIANSNYKITRQEEDDLFVFHIDFSSPMKINWSELSFANNEPEFIYSLSHVETAIHRFVNSHSVAIRYFEEDVKYFRSNIKKEKNREKKASLIQHFINKQLYNNDSEIFRLQYAAFCIDKMLKVFKRHVDTYKLNGSIEILGYLPEHVPFIQKAIKEVKKEEYV